MLKGYMIREKLRTPAPISTPLLLECTPKLHSYCILCLTRLVTEASEEPRQCSINEGLVVKTMADNSSNSRLCIFNFWALWYVLFNLSYFPSEKSARQYFTRQGQLCGH